MTSDSTYSIDIDSLTVIRTKGTGEQIDLNAKGDPCETVADLRAFVAELCGLGAYDAATRDALLLDIA